MKSATILVGMVHNSQKCDMVITKAISRFARNTVTTLKYARELREIGVEIYFEEEQINTTDAGGELLLTVHAAFAQEQSFNNSQDCKWRLQNKFKEGIPNNFQVYGYDVIRGIEMTVKKLQQIEGSRKL